MKKVIYISLGASLLATVAFTLYNNKKKNKVEMVAVAEEDKKMPNWPVNY